MIAWRVLLAEDDPLVAETTVDILAELPVEVSVVGSGREALERTQAAHPDLLLLSTMLPELDGFEVATALKASPETRDIPIIFMTARSRVEDKVRGLELGAEDCLLKPIRREELLARVKNVLRRAEAQRAMPSPETSLMRGRLEMMSLPNIIQALEVERRTGLLYVTTAGRSGEILFADGQIAAAMEGPRQGEAAVYCLLAWTEGEFALESTGGNLPPETRVTRSNQFLLMEGHRRLDEIPGLRRALAAVEGPVKMLPVFREGLLRRPLSPGFRRLVTLCDGTRPLPQVVEVSSLDPWETLTLLHRLFRLGMLAHGPAAKGAAPRLGVQLPAEFQSLKVFTTAQSFDISSRGLFLRTTQVLSAGEEILVRFKLPGVAHPFKAVGRVIWSSATETPHGHPAGMGIQFLDLNPQEQAMIEGYVVEHLLDRAVTGPQEEG
jgi:uncharacterized protein (TIGR02266 family)